MPLAALLGTLLTGIGTSIASALAYFAAWSGKRILLILAAVSAIAVSVGLLVTAIEGALASVAVAMPPEIQMAFLFLPTNIATCVTAIVTGHVAVWLYHLHLKVITIKTN